MLRFRDVVPSNPLRILCQYPVDFTPNSASVLACENPLVKYNNVLLRFHSRSQAYASGTMGKVFSDATLRKDAHANHGLD